jgi:hypothetical protein
VLDGAGRIQEWVGANRLIKASGALSPSATKEGREARPHKIRPRAKRGSRVESTGVNAEASTGLQF